MTRWKQFERLTAAIEALTHAGARVKWNTKIRGRQVDVEVRFGDGANAPLMVVECRWKGKPIAKVRVNEIEAFASKARRLGATRAVFATNTGYQSGAREAARDLAVEIYSISEFIDAWPAIVEEAVLTPMCHVSQVELMTPMSSEQLPEEPSVLSDLRFELSGKAPVMLGHLLHKALPDWQSHIAPFRFEISLPDGTEAVVGSRRVVVRGVRLTAQCVHVHRIIPSVPPPEIVRRQFAVTDAATNKTASIKDVDLPIGFDSQIAPGKYYRSVWGLEYRCEKIEATDMTLVLLPTRQQHGKTLSARVVVDRSYARLYDEITDPAEIQRLASAYSQFLTYPSGTVRRGDGIVLLNRGTILMPPDQR